MKRRTACLSLLLVSLLSGCGKTKEPTTTAEATEDQGPAPRRVVGYLPSYRSFNPDRFDLSALTHLCLAFANPTGEGSISDFDESVREQVPALVAAAHAKGVMVLASIAGGTSEQGQLVAEQTAPDKVDAYVAGLLELIERYNLDGIDNDIEGDAVNGHYESFVLKLSAALPEDKLLTAAIATKNGEPVSDAALAEYDFVNIMAYDHCSWSDSACDQSSYDGVLADLQYWVEERGVPSRKAVLGVPFYGWCWGCQEKQSALTYGQIASQYPERINEDWLVDGDKTISFNGPETIARKARLAHDYGGIMIWELGQDAQGAGALLQVIAAEQ